MVSYADYTLLLKYNPVVLLRVLLYLKKNIYKYSGMFQIIMTFQS